MIKTIILTIRSQRHNEIGQEFVCRTVIRIVCLVESVLQIAEESELARQDRSVASVWKDDNIIRVSRSALHKAKESRLVAYN